MKPSPTQVAAALETLAAGGWRISPPPNVGLRLITVAELAEILSVSPRRARELAEVIPGTVRLPGNDIRVRESALQKWMEQLPLNVEP